MTSYRNTLIEEELRFDKRRRTKISLTVRFKYQFLNKSTGNTYQNVILFCMPKLNFMPFLDFFGGAVPHWSLGYAWFLFFIDLMQALLGLWPCVNGTVTQ